MYDSPSIQVPRYGLDCIFLDRASKPGKALCSLYDLRPMQCRTWPFWSQNLENPEAWAAAGKECPGINSGQTVGLNKIKAILELESE
jgi:Fe-S-cluster containining protein